MSSTECRPERLAPSDPATAPSRSKTRHRASKPGRWIRPGQLVRAALVHLHRGPWWVASACLIGLVLAIASAGLVALAFNRTVQNATEGALSYDVALQDDADDLRVAILDVRHYHRNLMFYGPENDRLIEFDEAVADLQDEIDEIASMGPLDSSLTQTQVLRQHAEAYYAAFRPAVALYDTDRAAFEAASDEGLLRLAELEREARQIDRYAEVQADVAVARIGQASSNARLVLLVVLGGLILFGAVLIFAASRVFAEVRRLYGAEQAASKRLGEALQAKNNFVADVSHELRTPLTVVRGNAEAGLAIQSDCEHREFLEEIVGESARMTRLVEDLLFLARSDAAAPPLDLEPLAIAPLLAAVVERAEVLVHQRGGVLAVELAADGTVVADETRVEQTVLALVDNAAKFGPTGGTVYLSSSILQGELVVDVADQGPGIPESELAMIFERFYRTDKTRNRRRGGAGLGLSIARTIVEAHGGHIEAHSHLGTGTHMRIYLPLAKSTVPALPASVENATRARADVRASASLAPARLVAHRRRSGPRRRSHSGQSDSGLASPSRVERSEAPPPADVPGLTPSPVGSWPLGKERGA